MAIQGFFTGDVKIKDLNGILRAVDGIVDVISADTYVPYTGAITSVDLGANNITAQNFLSNGTGSVGGYMAFKQYSTSLSGIPGYTSIYAVTQNDLHIRYSQANGSQKIAQLSSAILGTTPRQYLFPDKDGTFALVGDIINLTFSSPLVNNSGVVSIPVATGSVDGYLSSTDWTTFNNKQSALNGTGFVKISGTTISYDNSTYYLASNPNAYIPLTALSFVAGSGAYNNTTGVITIPTNTSQLTNGANFITLVSLSGTAPIQYNNTTGAISITQSGSSSNGFLSSTDWNTFNSKQGAITLTTTGSSGAATLIGTTLNIPNYGSVIGNYVPYTGATNDVNLGVYTLSANSINIIGPGLGGLGGGYLGLKQNLSVLYGGGEYTSLTGEGKVYLSMYFSQDSIGTNYKLGRFDVSALTNNTQRTYSLPDASGTIALTSNLTGYLTAVTASSPLFSSGGTTPNITIQVANTSQNGYLSSTDWNTFNNKQAAGSYITALTGEATASGPGSASVTLSTSAVTGKLLTGLNLTGGGTIADTDSILQAFGKVQNQISGLAGGVTYQGTWNASTNTPTLTSSVGTKGYYYIVDVAGSTNLNGITDWKVGDWAIFNGSTWDKVDNTDAVSSVNGFTGAVSLTTSNIAEGTNLYYLDSRARLALSFTAGSGAYDNTTGVITIPTNTSQLTNGANFITLSSLSASSPLAYNSGTGAFSIQVATGSQNGYLSSTDWTTFNNKQNALTLTTTGTSGAATLVGATLNIPQYQSVLTNPVTGTGTTNYLPKFTGTSTIGNSQIFDDGTNVGIGTASPSYKLDVNGAGRFTGVLYADNTVRVGNAIIGINLNNLLLSSNTTGGEISFWNGQLANRLMTLNGSGNLSIGNTNDTYKLDVSGTGRFTGQLRLDSTITNGTYTYTLPSATGTLALTSDIPSVTGYVPYTGATANVDLGSYDLTTDIINLNQLKAVGSGGLNIYSNSGTHIALMGGGGGAGTTFYGGIIGVSASFTSSGSSDTFGITHSSGSGIALNITKGGNGEGLYINKTSGSGNAATIIGTLNATTLVKSGGTSSQFLKADGSVDSTAYGTGTVTSVGLSSATSGVTIGSTPITTSGTITLAIATASGSQQGLLSSTDWTTFNNKQNALTNPVTGTGTTNYLPKFTGASTIGNSQIFDNGSNVGVGTDTPSALFTVSSVGFDDTFFRVEQRRSGYASAINLVGATDAGAIYNRISSQTNGGTTHWQIGGGAVANTMAFYTGGTERMRLSASGNLGLGVTPSAWNIGSPVIQMGTGVHFFGAGIQAQMGSNNFYNGTNYIYSSSNFASRYLQNNGNHIWENAPSGTAGNAITFTQAMTLDASGRLLVGTTSNVFGERLTVNNWITAGDLTRVALMGQDGTNVVFGAYSNHNLVLRTDNTTRLTIASTGAATFSSSITTNATSTFSNASSLSAIFSNGGAVNNYNSIELRGGTAGTSVNWQISKDNTLANGFELAPSTTAGGTTYGSSVFKISSAGAATFSNLAGTGTRMVVADANGLLSTQAIGSGAITGSGTTNYLPKFTGASTIGDSQVFDNGTNVGIGTATPTTKLSVYAATGGSTTGLTVNGSSNMLNLFGSSSTGAGVIFDATDGTVGSATAVPIIYRLGGTERMRLDTSGNLGLGVTPSAWSTFTAIQVTTGGAFYAYQNPFEQIGIVNNGYFNGSGWIYTNSGSNSTRYHQYDGQHLFYTAPSGTAGNAISFTQAMTLDASGNLALGGTSNKVTGLSGGGTGFTVQATAAPTIGVWDNSDASYYLQLGQIEANSYLWNIANGFLSFGTANTERMRLNASGNLGLGVTPSAWSAYTALQIKNSAYYAYSVSGIHITGVGSNIYYDGSQNKYISNGFASTYLQLSGEHRFYTAPSGTAGNNISLTQAMTLAANGNLLVGTTSDNGAKFQVTGGATFSSSVQLTGNGSGLSTTYGGVTTSNLFTTTTGAVLSVDGDWTIKFKYSGVSGTDMLSLASTGATFNSSIKTGEPDTGWGRAAIKIGARVSGTAFGVGGYLPVSVDGTVYYINLNSSTP
jgi:hypothetical protein